jgi:hypothetical protein
MPTRQVPIVQPSESLKHSWTWTWPVHKTRHLLTIRTELLDFIESSTQNKVIHMELSLRLSFLLRHNLRGYTVGTTTEFQVKTMEALAQ